MNQKYKTIIAIILAVWIFAMGIVIGDDSGYEKGYKEGSEAAVQQQQQNNNSEPPTRPSNPMSDSGNTNNNGNTNNGGDTNNGGSTDNGTNNGGNNDTNNGGNTPADPTTYTDEQIVQMLNYYVNYVKTEPNMSATKTEKITVNVTALSVDALRDTVNGIVGDLIGDGGETVEYTFVNGAVTSTTDEEANIGDSPYALIPPLNKDFLVTMDGIADASVTVDANGNVTYKVVLVSESTTLQAPVPKYNSTAVGYLDLAGLDISPAKITTADMYYSGSTISVTVDSQDRVIELYSTIPMTGKGEAGIGFISGSAEFGGGQEEKWTFSY